MCSCNFKYYSFVLLQKHAYIYNVLQIVFSYTRSGHMVGKKDLLAVSDVLPSILLVHGLLLNACSHNL